MTQPNGGVARREEQPKPPVPLSGPIADLDSAYRYATALAQADLMPHALRGKPSNVLAIILYGQYLNVPPMVAIQSISVVNGRPQIEGKLLIAKVREAGHKLAISDHTPKSCTVTITRGDDGFEHTETYTWEDAETAKLTGKDNYKHHPKQMMLWRAVGHCVDIACPEVKMGFGVEGEDVADDPRPSLAQVAAERADRKDSHPEIEAAKPEVNDEATAAEIVEIQAQHTAPATTDELSYDEAMEAEMLAFEAQQAGVTAEDGQ